MERRTPRAELVVVALISAAVLGFGIQSTGVASGYVDQILKAGAQDEAVYGHAAAAMVRTGSWLTPEFLHRFMLNKPPLLMWLGSLGMRVFSMNPVALRIVPIGAAVLCCVVVYAWLRRSLPVLAAASGVLLLLGNSLFHSMARKFMTDILLTLLITSAVFVLSLDPRFARIQTATLFGLLCGAAILTKSAAGAMPLLILIAYCFVAGNGDRPSAGRVVIALGAAAAVAAPWHVYQFVVHRDWFMSEYVRFQLLGSGISAPSRYTNDSNLSFYAWRLVALSPLLLSMCAVSAVFWKRYADESQARLIAVWCVAGVVCPLAFGTRVAYYLLPLMPAMAVAAVQLSPLFQGRWVGAMFCLLIVSFGVKAALASATWGLDYRREAVPAAAALEKYAQFRRTNELVIVAPDDEFYSAVLDLPRVRYAFLGNVDSTKTTQFFYWLGINVSTADFCNLEKLAPEYAQHLAAWGLRDARPIGSIIAGGSNLELATIVRCSPDRDFFLPESLREAATEAGGLTHIPAANDSGRFFLLAKRSARRDDIAPQPGTVIATRSPVR
jgi:4-amino-4-deoxy-L-arabinose transferase-like glycosyltransferase